MRTRRKTKNRHNIFAHEMDTLECEICYLPFQDQVYTCKNGHAACGDCCINMSQKCSCCNEPIGDFQCRAMEKILAGMSRPCKFKKNGCGEVVRFTEMRGHEEACGFAPYHCPFDGCAYRGLLLHAHIKDEHTSENTTNVGYPRCTAVTLAKGEPFRVLLHRDRESLFVLLNGGHVLTGRSLAVACICPSNEDVEMEREIEYKMEVKGSEPRLLSLMASGTVPFVRLLEGFQAKEFLFVPDSFWGSSGSVTATVHV